MKQLSVFSTAEDSMSRAVEAIRNLDLEQAEREIEAALRIDPSTINPGVLQNLIGLFKKWNPKYPLADFLAGLWLSGAEEGHVGLSGSAEAELMDREIAEIAFRRLEPAEGFIDKKKTVHWGFLHVSRGEYSEARRMLSATLSDGFADRADLWAAYADALWGLGRRMESTAAFIRALVIDSFRVDLRRTKLREARLLFDKLSARHSLYEARAMLLLQGWIEGLWEIKRPDKSVQDLEKDIRKRIAKTDDSDRPGKLRRFSLYFYLDRIKSSGDIDIEARERMIELEPDLFRMYLSKLGEMQKDIFC